MCAESENIIVQITITIFSFFFFVLRLVVRKDNTVRKQKISQTIIRHGRH